MKISVDSPLLWSDEIPNLYVLIIHCGSEYIALPVGFKEVKIVDGAFMGLTGQVSMVDPDKGKLKVEVSIFNRKVQVDVEYWQVEKVAIEETFTEAK